MTQGEKDSQINPVQQISPSLSDIYRLQSRFWSSSDLYMHAPSANSIGLSLAAWGRQHLHTQPHLLCTYVPILKLSQRGRPRPICSLALRLSSVIRPSPPQPSSLLNWLTRWTISRNSRSTQRAGTGTVSLIYTPSRRRPSLSCSQKRQNRSCSRVISQSPPFSHC